MTRPIKLDRRRLRGFLTRRGVIEATRRVMAAGNFRPTAKEIGRADGFSARSVHVHFPTLESLYRAALDADTSHAIAAMLAGQQDERKLALAVVLGRLP